MNQKLLRQTIFNQKYGRLVESIEYWGTCILGGIIGFVWVFAIYDLLFIISK